MRPHEALGTVTYAADYNGFGKLISSTGIAGDRYGYTGQQKDSETNFQLNWWRYYDAETGRWISQDPTKFIAGDANLYRYVGNNSVNLSDHTGLRREPTIPRRIVEGIREFFNELPIGAKIGANGKINGPIQIPGLGKVVINNNKVSGGTIGLNNVTSTFQDGRFTFDAKLPKDGYIKYSENVFASKIVAPKGTTFTIDTRGNVTVSNVNAEDFVPRRNDGDPIFLINGMSISLRNGKLDSIAGPGPDGTWISYNNKTFSVSSQNGGITYNTENRFLGVVTKLPSDTGALEIKAAPQGVGGRGSLRLYEKIINLKGSSTPATISIDFGVEIERIERCTNYSALINFRLNW